MNNVHYLNGKLIGLYNIIDGIEDKSTNSTDFEIFSCFCFCDVSQRKMQIFSVLKLSKK